MSKDYNSDTSKADLNEVIKELKNDQEYSIEGLTDKLNNSFLAQQLFARAPEGLFRNKSTEELVEIVRVASQTLNELLNNTKTPQVKVLRNKNYSSIWLAMGDKPFIVNSITECIRHRGWPIVALLHPIIILDGYRFSLVYLELPSLTEEELALVERRLRESIEALRITTDDFTPMLVRTETLARTLEGSNYKSPLPKEQNREIAAFLHWLTDGGFVFLGYSELLFNDDEVIQSKSNPELGLFRTPHRFLDSLIHESVQDAKKLNTSTIDSIIVSKIKTESIVHRRQKLTCISVLEHDSDCTIRACHSIVGLFTSKALSQESSSVPLIRQKLSALIKSEGVYENSFNFKGIVNIVDSMPKDEAFRMSVEEFREVIHTIMGIQNKDETRVNIRIDQQQRGATILAVIPRDRFNTQTRDRIQKYIEGIFNIPEGSSDYHLDLSNKPHARLYFYVPLPYGEQPTINLADLEKNIAVLSRTWLNNLEEIILSGQKQLLDSETSAELSPEELWHKYGTAFTADYQALQSVEDAQFDIGRVECLDQESPLTVALSQGTKQGQSILVIYSLSQEVTLSQALPILENAGLHAISEVSSVIKPRAKDIVHVYRFVVTAKNGIGIDLPFFNSNVSAGLQSIFLGNSENDILNSLMLTSKLKVRQISVLRTYANLLGQISNFVGKEAILTTMAAYPEQSKALWNYFETKFDIEKSIGMDQRIEESERALASFKDLLRIVSDINSDRILRNLSNLIEHTLRTNYYHGKPEIVIKLKSNMIDIMPEPRPAYEIFVCSPSIQGVHLRGGPIARGGLRWSERYQDFRREVLGLMKTQRVKNALIVPDGAKGGFIVNKLSNNPDEIPEQVKNAYKTFIRSLLSITDNRLNDEVVHPPKTIVWDGQDPYFVVAADRGTATFSDVANEIAINEYNFWLGDAFASGGSKGYDHKKYAITAKGAWECVLHHFRQMGLDYENADFSAVGLGDMSGDVFGNGLLLSQRIKLLAAFNHKHIFIDPAPNASESFKERERLFNLPKSQWSDYDISKISDGGGIFNRFDKEIHVNEQIKIALSADNLNEEVMSGEDLVKLILKSKVDLLWNGGIGTYVKASFESNASVNDGTNDSVRVNATELRASVVGEGGNLGFTQAARIEFAQSGGLINTDAIDNSGGVDLSDHEVNLKILYASLEKANLVDRKERDETLLKIAPEVIEDVLAHNRAHALVLTMGETRSKRNIAYFRTLIQEVHRKGYINRSIEQLPDDDELVERAAKEHGLCRPELAVCLSAVKLQIKYECMQSELLNDPLLTDFLLKYFPKALQEKHKDAIQSHPLASQIIATQISNTLIDSMGVTFVHRMCLNHSMPPIVIIKCALGAWLILKMQEIREQLIPYNTFKDYKNFLFLRRLTSTNLRDATSWLINFYANMTLYEMVEYFQDSYHTLASHIMDDLPSSMTNRSKEILEQIEEMHLPELLKNSAISTGLTRHLLEMLWASKQTTIDARELARIYATVANCLNLTPIMEKEDVTSSTSRWETELLTSAFVDLKRGISELSLSLIRNNILSDDEILSALRESVNYQHLYDTILEMQDGKHSPAGLSILAKQLGRYSLRGNLN